VEEELLPILRANNCSFVAYNPLAAGLLTGRYSNPTGDSSTSNDAPKGRFRNNPNYLPRFYTGSNHQAVDVIRKACDEAGIGMVEATYRWLLCHSALQQQDGALLGASSVTQLKENLDACQKTHAENSRTVDALPATILHAFDEAWAITRSAGVFPYFRSYSADFPNRESLDQGASYEASKKK
jgi:aflatoxin B1 aldehyde reductase